MTTRRSFIRRAFLAVGMLWVPPAVNLFLPKKETRLPWTIDPDYTCVMEINQPEMTLYSEEWTLVVDTEIIQIENFST